MKDFYTRTKSLAHFIITNNATIRQTAKHFNMAKSTVHYDVSIRLKKIDYALSLQVKNVLDKNFAEKHLRGGNATKNKYKKAKEKSINKSKSK